jgi:hypothetical protein
VSFSRRGSFVTREILVKRDDTRLTSLGRIGQPSTEESLPLPGQPHKSKTHFSESPYLEHEIGDVTTGRRHSVREFWSAGPRGQTHRFPKFAIILISPLFSKEFILTLPKWRAIFVTIRECDKKLIIRPYMNSTCVTSAASRSFCTPIQIAGTNPIKNEKRLCAYSTTELRRASRPLTHSARLSLWYEVTGEGR